ncbi:MAG: TrkA family potassium uptake protein [Micrococcales bacterium]|nr:TrkA family potassium uptake protein [Micrococcales bacterium]
MKVTIAGAGSVGLSIARELLSHDHQVVLIEKDPAAIKIPSVPEADWILADACELSALHAAKVDECDVVVAATGDDKVNLVLALLAKSEFGVTRVVGRVNNPKNEWLFDDTWGVDVAVSTPRIMTALVEEAVSVGDLVRLFTFGQSGAGMVEITLPTDSPLAGRAVGSMSWPTGTVLVGIIRDQHPFAPVDDDTIEARDELLFVADSEGESALRELLRN